MIAIANRHKRAIAINRFFDGELHGANAYQVPESVVTVDNRSRARLPYRANHRPGIGTPGAEPGNPARDAPAPPAA